MDRQLRTANWVINGACVSVLLLCAFAYYSYFFAPLKNKQDTQQEQIARLSRLVAATSRSRGKSSELRQQLEDLGDRARQIRQRIPDQPQEASFLGLVSNAAAAHGLTIDDYRRGRTSNQGSHWQLEVTLHGRGTFEGICRFVQKLENLPRQVTIRDFQVNRQGVGETYPIVVSVLLYYGANQVTGGSHG